MITRIEARGFRCLRYASQDLGPFHVLVGPNASGKTTFLDTVSFLGRMVSDGLDAAVSERTANFPDLVWGRQGNDFELAVEAAVPEHCRGKLARPFASFRYEIKVGIDPDSQQTGILDEKAWLQQPAKETGKPEPRDLFPMERTAPATILTSRNGRWQRVLSKAHGGNDNFHVEVRQKDKQAGKGWFPSIRLGPRKSALANLP